MTSVFINYRRRDEAYAAALLDEKLSRTIGPEAIFRASRSIRAGQDYEAAILAAIAECQVMLVIVGQNWPGRAGFTTTDPREDWVQREITEAFEQDLHVVPILLSGVDRIVEDDIPETVSKIARLQYLRFDYRNIEQDSIRIEEELRALIPDLN